MTVPSRITNHYDQMVDDFPTQFQDKPNIDALLQTWNTQIQELEDSLWSIYDKTKFFEASGVNLDRYGNLLGLKRPAGMSDGEFFSLVAGEIVARASDATTKSIRKTTEAVTGLYNTNIIEINNPINWAANGYGKLAGDVMVYGYYNKSDRVLSGFEGNLLRRACPITTEVAIFGQHIQFDEDVNSLFIPCEVILSPDGLAVESPTGNPLDELSLDAVGTDKLGVTGTNFEAFGDNWELSILPEDSTDGGSLSVNSGEGFENFYVDTEEGQELFNVQTEGVQTDHGIMLEIAYSAY